MRHAGKLERTDWLWLAALTLAFGFLFLGGSGSYSLWDPWETRFAATAGEMAERGDYLAPRLDGRIQREEPILTYWLMLATTGLLGRTEFALRLPMMLAAVGGVLMLYYVVRRLRGRSTAILAACILGTLPQYVLLARQATAEMPFALFVGCAMGFFALARFTDDPPGRYVAAFAGSAALAFLTKGSVALLLIVGALLIFLLLDGRGARRISATHALLGLLVFLAIAGPWVGTMWLRYPETFVGGFFGDVEAGPYDEPIREGADIAERFVATLFHGLYPWIGALPLGALFLFQGLRDPDENVRQRWYFLAWLAAAFLSLTLDGDSLDQDTLPLSLPVAVLIALIWEAYLGSDRADWVRPVLLSSIAFACLPLRDFLVEGSEWIFDSFTTRIDLDFPLLDETLLGLLVAWSLAVALAVLRERSRLAVVLLVFVAFTNALFLGRLLVPAHAGQRSMKAYVEHYETVREPDAELVFYGWKRRSMDFYLGKDDYRYYPPNEVGRLARLVESRRHVYLIAQTRYVERLMKRLERRREFRWVRADAPLEHDQFLLLKKVPARRDAPELQQDWRSR